MAATASALSQVRRGVVDRAELGQRVVPAARGRPASAGGRGRRWSWRAGEPVPVLAVAAPVVLALLGDAPARLVVAVVPRPVRAGRRRELPGRVVGVGVAPLPVRAGLGGEPPGRVVGVGALAGGVGGGDELAGAVVAEQPGPAAGVGGGVFGDDAAVVVAGQPGRPLDPTRDRTATRRCSPSASATPGPVRPSSRPSGSRCRSRRPSRGCSSADDPPGAVAAVAGRGAVGVGQRGAQPVGVVGPADDLVAGRWRSTSRPAASQRSSIGGWAPDSVMRTGRARTSRSTAITGVSPPTWAVTLRGRPDAS